MFCLILLLEPNGNYDMSDEKSIDDMKREIRARMQTLSVPIPNVASEYYTASEMVSRNMNIKPWSKN